MTMSELDIGVGPAPAVPVLRRVRPARCPARLDADLAGLVERYLDGLGMATGAARVVVALQVLARLSVRAAREGLPADNAEAAARMLALVHQWLVDEPFGLLPRATPPEQGSAMPRQPLEPVLGRGNATGRLTGVCEQTAGPVDAA